jgi:hypothetical protein
VKEKKEKKIQRYIAPHTFVKRQKRRNEKKRGKEGKKTGKKEEWMRMTGNE